MTTFYSKEVSGRARQIVSTGGVLLNPTSTPRHLSFLVSQRSGQKCEVWRTIDNYGVVRWSCNAARGKGEDKEHSDVQVKGKFGCVFNTTVRNDPFCSHTLAAALFMEGAK